MIIIEKFFRTVIIYAVVVFTAVSLVGCAGNGRESSKDARAVEAAAQQGISGDVQGEQEQEHVQSDESDVTQEETVNERIAKPVIEESVLLENDSFRITAVSLELTDGDTLYLTLRFENFGDEGLYFTTGSFNNCYSSINSYMVSGFYMSAYADPGETVQEKSGIELCENTILGIKKIFEVGIGFEVNNEDYSVDYTTGPLYVRSSDVEGYDTSTDTYLNALQDSSSWPYTIADVDDLNWNDFLDQEELKGISSCLVTNETGQKSLFLEIENISEEDLEVKTGHISINGAVVSSYSCTSAFINSGKKRVMEIPLDELVLSEELGLEYYGINELVNVGIRFHCENLKFEDIFYKDVVIRLSGENDAISLYGEEVYNGNDIRIISDKIIKDDPNCIYMLLFAENNSSGTVEISEERGSITINGIETDSITYGAILDPGEKGFIDIEVGRPMFEEAGFKDLYEVSEAEFTLEILDANENVIDTAEVKMLH